MDRGASQRKAEAVAGRLKMLLVRLIHHLAKLAPYDFYTSLINVRYPPRPRGGLHVMTLTPVIHHLAKLVPYDFLYESDQRQVATAATRWIACDDADAAHLPSGDIGYGRLRSF
jgi:hypothetical protein